MSPLPTAALSDHRVSGKAPRRSKSRLLACTQGAEKSGWFSSGRPCTSLGRLRARRAEGVEPADQPRAGSSCPWCVPIPEQPGFSICRRILGIPTRRVLEPPRRSFGTSAPYEWREGVHRGQIAAGSPARWPLPDALTVADQLRTSPDQGGTSTDVSAGQRGCRRCTTRRRRTSWSPSPAVRVRRRAASGRPRQGRRRRSSTAGRRRRACRRCR